MDLKIYISTKKLEILQSILTLEYPFLPTNVGTISLEFLLHPFVL